VGKIVLRPGAGIESRVAAAGILDVRVPGTQRLLGATAAIGQLTFSSFPIRIAIRIRIAALVPGAGWMWWVYVMAREVAKQQSKTKS